MSERLTDDALAAKLVGGLRPTRVELREYDPAWPARYEACAAQLRTILGDRARLIEHIGSTSVPGLVAKPVIDIVAGIDAPDDEPAYVPELEAAGYVVRVREPEHRCLRLERTDGPVNLHCYPPDHLEVRRYLVFRDRLRADAADRARYAAVKRELARHEWRDINYYAEAKWPVIREILGNAGWTE
ncbi:GrpB family protein [Prauserella muralis]|nr:GrpB family protein [Prauserella muralis]TWE14107.1 GrpB-like predicted nucleotidyltransferase (UPF0157 family) [Prauserella muralis]